MDDKKFRQVAAVVFDLDGTLLNTIPDIARVFNTVFRKNGLPEHPAQRYKLFVGRGLMNTLKKAVPANLALSAAELEQMLQEILSDYQKNPHLETKPYPGIPELLKELNTAGIPLAVLSNKDHVLTVPITKACLPGIDFAVVQGKSDDYPLKPHPGSVLALMDILNSTPDNTMMIGDTIVDFQTARNSGMQPVLVEWGFTGREALVSEGCLPIASTAEELRYIIFSRLKK
jgi:phosphoglycolate phosphatase